MGAGLGVRARLYPYAGRWHMGRILEGGARPYDVSLRWGRLDDSCKGRVRRTSGSARPPRAAEPEGRDDADADVEPARNAGAARVVHRRCTRCRLGSWTSWSTGRRRSWTRKPPSTMSPRVARFLEQSNHPIGYGSRRTTGHRSPERKKDSRSQHVNKVHNLTKTHLPKHLGVLYRTYTECTLS